jgi:hypothetical protein
LNWNLKVLENLSLQALSHALKLAQESGRNHASANSSVIHKKNVNVIIKDELLTSQISN